MLKQFSQEIFLIFISLFVIGWLTHNFLDIINI